MKHSSTQIFFSPLSSSTSFLLACQEESAPNTDAATELDMNVAEDISINQLDMNSLSEATDMAVEEDRPFLPPRNLQDDESNLLFDSNRLIQIEINLEEANWDELRYQTRTLNLIKPRLFREAF